MTDSLSRYSSGKLLLGAGITILAIAAAMLACPAAAIADTVFVDITRGNDFTGSGSIERPYKHIAKGLAEANYGDTVMVSAGEYSAATGETLPLILPNGVTLQGDTSSAFTSPEEMGTRIEGHNAGPLIYIEGRDSNTVLDGVAIMGNNSPSNGAGVIIRGGAPKIRDCTFYALNSPSGSAIYAAKDIYAYCQPRIERCMFYACTASSGTRLGGAVYLNGTETWLQECSFYGCTTTSTGRGGAVALRGGGSTTMAGCFFLGCGAPDGAGGGIDAIGHSLGVFSSGFAGCGSEYGGAIFIQDDGAGDPEALFVANSVILECSLTGGDNVGAAIRTLAITGIVRNSTISDNVGGSIVANHGSALTIDNSVLWNPDASADDILTTGGGTTSLSYSCITDADAGPFVIHSNPMLNDESLAVMPMAGSPVIDAGNNAVAPTNDFSERPRIVDGDGNGVATVDMGASERTQIADRAAGPNRYATAVAASQEHFDHADLVVLATGGSYPDALCAAPLAGHYYAPILLTPTESLAPAVVTELERLEAEEIILVGGTGAISSSVEFQLESLGYRVDRIAGANRYTTSQAVAQRIADLSPFGMTDTVLVARGDDFPDALAISPFAYDMGYPILLTPPNHLPAGFADKVTGLGFTEAVIAGGTGAVSAGVEADIDALLTGTIDRIAGANRYETAIAFAWFVDTDPRWSGYYTGEFVGLAIGSNFPDALCGGPVCSQNRGPILLTGPTALPTGVSNYMRAKSNTLTHVQAFGGTGVISDSVLAEARSLMR